MKIGSVCSRSSSQTSLHCTVLSCYPTWRIIWLFQMLSSTWKNVSSYLKHCLVLLTISDPEPCPITLNYPIYSHSSLKSILYTDKLNWSSSIKITISYSRKCLAWVRRDLQKLHIGKEVWAPTQHYNLFLIATYIYFIPLYPSLSKSQ